MRSSITKVTLVVLLLSLALGSSLQCSEGTPALVDENPAVSNSNQIDKIDKTQAASIEKIYAASDQKAVSVDSDLVASNTEFAFNIFRELIKDKDDKDKNIFMSPLSISIALTMTYNGAGSTTKEAMGKTLKFQNRPLDEINQGYSELIDSLEGVDEEIKLRIANSIWMQKGFDSSVKPDFKQRVSEYFDGEVFARDFNQQTADEINSWVSQETEGKIDKLVESLSTNDLMLLINAIYFKGAWVYEFDESLTRKEDFNLPDGSIVSVDMMSRMAPFDYYESDSFEAVRLPYGRDKVAMYVFLPDKDVPLETFIASLNQQQFDKYISGFKSEGLTVRLPRFKIEYGTKRLNDALINLGMGIAFSGSADFSDMASVPLSIAYVDHKAIIEVNEKGSEAAAATVVGMTTSVPPTFSVDRPFLFVIRDDRSGSILFMGKVIDPTRS